MVGVSTKLAPTPGDYFCGCGAVYHLFSAGWRELAPTNEGGAV